ncbi:MAG: DinB family protein [Gemmatimonadaceae bacterium]
MTESPRVGTKKPRSVADEIAAALRRAHSGNPWHGPSRAMLLEDVTPAIAAWHPGAGAHSVWETVLHMRSWTREVERRLRGGAPGDPADGDWPAVGTMHEKSWRAAFASLDAAHESLVAAVLETPESKFAERMAATPGSPEGSGVSYRTMLLSLAEHDIYHSGQIALLKRLARAALEQ